MATVTRRRRSDEDEEETRPRSRRDRDEVDRDEEDEDEPPRSTRSARRRDHDDDDERPRGRRPSRDEEDEDEPPRRSRRSSSRDEEEDDEPPRRSRRSSRDDDEDDAPPARSRRVRGRAKDEDDDEDERPRSRRGRSRDDEDADEGVGSGWAGSRQNRKEMQNNDRLDLDKTHQLVKFLEDSPFASVHVHWVPGENGRQRMLNGPKRKADCPLCEANHVGSPYDFFNIVLMPGEDENGKITGDPKLMYIRATPGLSKEIESKAGARSGPLTKPYYEMWKEGGETRKDGPPKWKMEVVRERDLDEEWGVDPLTEDELDEFFDKAKTLKDVHTPASRDELKAAARDFRDRE